VLPILVGHGQDFHDIGMIQLAQGLTLALEALQQLGHLRCHLLPQGLDRYCFARERIAAQVYTPGRASADHFARRIPAGN
jgi:hypothetical protein